jgi:SAM-dependent methyltransferase
MNDVEILRKIYHDFYILEEYPEYYSESCFINYEKCLEYVEKIITEMVKCGELILGTWHYDYHIMHKCRFALTLSHIPKAVNADIVLEVGASTIFSVFLTDILGYKTIYGTDITNNTGSATFRKRSLNSNKYEQFIVNIDLNKIPDDIQIPKFSKIFFFEVLEHLHHPIRALKFLRSILNENGELYLSCPNCASTYTLSLLTKLFIPFTYSVYNDMIEDAHFREQTPLTLKYALMHAGFKETAFCTFYLWSEDNIHDPLLTLYPFPGETIINRKLRGDMLFSVARPNTVEGSDYPDLFYDFGKFQQAFNYAVPITKRNAYTYFSEIFSYILSKDGLDEVHHKNLLPCTVNYKSCILDMRKLSYRYLLLLIKKFIKKLLYSFGYIIIKTSTYDNILSQSKKNVIDKNIARHK